MRTFVIAAATAGLLLGTAPARSDEEGTIKYRQSVMKAVGGHTGALAQIGKGNVMHTAHAQAHADALVALSKQVLAAFKEEAIMGETRAKENIWSDWAGFEKVASDFENATTKLAAAAADGNVGAGLKELFDSCKGCHKDYRAKAE